MWTFSLKAPQAKHWWVENVTVPWFLSFVFLGNDPAFAAVPTQSACCLSVIRLLKPILFVVTLKLESLTATSGMLLNSQKPQRFYCHLSQLYTSVQLSGLIIACIFWFLPSYSLCSFAFVCEDLWWKHAVWQKYSDPDNSFKSAHREHIYQNKYVPY